ncbi:MAG: hypothetical protein ACE5G1_16855 [bacterium]
MSDKQECDLIVQKDRGIMDALQVCWSLKDEATHKREIRGLHNTAKRFNLPSGFIITFDEEEQIDGDGTKSSILPCWKWLLMRASGQIK